MPAIAIYTIMRTRISLLNTRAFALLTLGIISMFVAPLSVMSQTVVFSDNFGSSTLSPTAVSPGIISANRTAYEIASTKSLTPAISGNSLSLPLSTSSGYAEAQAQFTTTAPITLNTAGAYIQLYYTFTDSPTMFSGNAGAQEQLIIGLYNSGGSGPTNGTLLNNGLTTAVTAVNGGTKNWLGYSATFSYNTNNSSANVYASSINTRVAQTGADNRNQGLGNSAGYALPTAGAQIVSYAGVSNAPVLTIGNYYTVALKITYVNSTTLAITNTLYNGAGISGSVVNVSGFNANYGGTATGANVIATTFDSFAVGFRPTSSPTTAETLQITNITVLDYIPAAPTITALTNQTVTATSNTTLVPIIGGVPTPTYFQWATNGVNIPGATSSTLALNNVQYSQNGYVYSLITSNSVGFVSNAMTLTVIVTPSINGLNNQTASPGDNVTISPTSVTGVPTPTYQWQTNGVNLVDGVDANGSTISGSTSSSLSIANAQVADSGTYFLIASNSAGKVTNSMVLAVSSSPVAPGLTGPANITVIQGNNGTFTASASGSPVPALQWLDQTGTPIGGATSSSLTLNNVQYSQNGYVYSIVASNVVGSVTNSATLTVIVPPSITTQPTNLVVTNTQAASFTVAATGVPTPTYQWNKNGTPISSVANNSATNATFTIASAGLTDAATYSVTVVNSAGTSNSVSVTLTVNSAVGITTLSPANGATGICYDTPLTITFNAALNLGSNATTIKIYNVNNSVTPVDSITVTNGVQARTFPGDAQAFAYQTIQTTGNTVKISPHFSVMSSNATYYVTIDNGAFTDAAGANFAGITATNVWKFSTKVGGPVDTNNPVVNANGSADFVTVQGAINSLTSTNATPRVVSIRNGLYNEIVDIAGKHYITLRGQSRTGAIISFPNNSVFQTPVNNGTTHARMSFKVNANDIAFDSLTISNSTPQGGSQAEALMIETSAKRCIVNNSDIVSRQDTILANVNSSQAYFYKSAVRGNFDYIWGGGNLYFDQCTIKTISGTGSGQLTAARTDTSASTSANFPWVNPFGTYTANGMSFVNCSFAVDAGLGAITLAGSNGTSNNLVSWYGCDFATNYVAPSSTLLNGNYVFWQGANTTNGVSVTFPVLTTISGADARLQAATNIPTWFYGWSPQLAPNILTNPISQTVNYGSPATFTVVATGIPDPTYQWQTNGVNLSGATSSTLTIPSAALTDAGSYTVVVTTSAGTATSSSATLTVNPPSNTAPTFTAPPGGTNAIINVGASLTIGCTATDSDTPAQTLTYALLTGPSGAAVNSSSGNFTWRPTVAQAGSVNVVKVSVTDNGTPNLSATNTFTVTVNALTQPTATTPNYSAGQFSVGVSGQVGPDYALQATTNLAGGTWTTVASTNSPATMPVILTDPNASAQPMQFYRVVTGPPLP